ncbi:hypothetical protein D3C73_1045300 [compost metagenome]
MTRTIAGLFLELALCRRQYIFARLDQTLGQRQLVGIGATAIFFDQHGMLCIEHRHDHHCTISSALAHQPLVSTLRTVGKAQLELFNAEQTAGGDNLAGEDSGFLAHEKLLGVNGLLYPAYPDC